MSDDGTDRDWPEFPAQLRKIANQLAGNQPHTASSVKVNFAARLVESQAKRIAELEASVLTQHMWMTERGHSLPPDSVKGLERYTELEAEVAALRVDAGRWNWLLEEHNSDGPSWHVRLPNNEVPGVDLCAAIDAAKEQQ